jgi:hypothetical protein
MRWSKPHVEVSLLIYGIIFMLETTFSLDRKDPAASVLLHWILS